MDIQAGKDQPVRPAREQGSVTEEKALYLHLFPQFQHCHCFWRTQAMLFSAAS